MKPKSAKNRFPNELAIQDWVRDKIAEGSLREAIQGIDALERIIGEYDAPDFLPGFPIDYWCRIQCLRSAKQVSGELFDLDLVSTNRQSISRTKTEALFVDLLYANKESGHFVIVEVKNAKSTARETITELLAYEHEVLNHLPFASSRDICFVIVAREYSSLLDHAVTGLVAWGRKNVLCLRFDESGEEPMLAVHIPQKWTSIGQGVLPATGIKTAQLSLYPNDDMDSAQILKVMETALAMLVRDADRIGGAGFAMIVGDHLYPKLTQSPFAIIAGAINPFCFMPLAEELRLGSESDSPLAAYLLNDENREELPLGWAWIETVDSVTEYLKAYGRPTWEGFDHWNNFRNVERWRHHSLTPDRHLCPLITDFWGTLGDYAREFIRNAKRVNHWMPGFSKPGLDWRYPHLGVFLLDSVCLQPVVQGGRWTFSALHSLGMRLGRLASIGSQFADANPERKRLLLAQNFWAESDVIEAVHEVAWRYQIAAELKVSPPRLPIGGANDGADFIKTVTTFCDWITKEFIGPRNEMLQHAFVVGLQSWGLYDAACDIGGKSPETIRMKNIVADVGRSWLKHTAVAFQSLTLDPEVARDFSSKLSKALGLSIQRCMTKAQFFAAIDGLDKNRVIDAMFSEVPELVSIWHPHLFHNLLKSASGGRDWDWYEQQIKESRARGTKYPCIIRSAGGHIGVGRLPEDGPKPPIIRDPETEVLLLDCTAGFELTLRVTWEELRCRG